jgi:hypothetical protein
MRRYKPLLAALTVSGVLMGLPQAAAAITIPTFPPVPALTAAGLGTSPTLATAAGVGMPNSGNASSANGLCGASVAGGGGTTGYTASQNCLGSGLVFVGPAIGQIASVIGPTIISPGFTGTVNVSAGNITGP